MQFRFLFVSLLAVLIFPAGAGAATCTVGVSSLDFSAVDTLTGNARTTADISIRCNDAASSTITVCGNIGAGSGGTSGGHRQMVSGSGSLQFGLFADEARSVPWGHMSDPTLGSPRRIVLPVAEAGASADVTLYGSIAGGQTDARTGSYSAQFSAADAVFYYAEGDALQCDAPAGASSAMASFTASASVSANCLIEAEDIAFGSVGLITQNIDASGRLHVTCTPGAGYSIALDGGLSGAAEPAGRRMRSGDETVLYGLYSDPGRTAGWGSTPGSTVEGEGSGEEVITIYGRVPPQQARPGDYTDTVVVTISYR